MKAVFGLGNPGAQYAKTRHNFGFWVIEALAESLKFPPAEPTRLGWLYHTPELILMRPTTYMNLSGEAVAWLLSAVPLTPDDILVVIDDFALPLGKIRLRARGSAGGHNGLKSIEHHLGTRDYARLKVGIGPVPEDEEVVDFVLGEFGPEDQKLVPPVVSMAKDCCLSWIEQGVQQTMADFNGRFVEGNSKEDEKLTHTNTLQEGCS